MTTLQQQINKLHDQLSQNGWQVNSKALIRLMDILEVINNKLDELDRNANRNQG